jgi:hypothetical protein
MVMIRKDLVVVALCTFCLTACLFMVSATRSAFEYDPWLDYNEDGVIDVSDLHPLGGSYGTMGDSTKNVTIAGHVNKLAFNVSTGVESYSAYYTGWISVDGYSKVTICISTETSVNSYRLVTSHYAGHAYTVDEATNFQECLVRTYDVPNEQIRVTFVNMDEFTVDLDIDVYLIP